MKLYTSQMSSSARRVNLTVAHLGIQLEQMLVDLRKQEDRAALGAVNPNHKIPALADPTTGLALWESHAIMQYLCDRDPARRASLSPTDVVVRADSLEPYPQVRAYVARVEALATWKATEPPSSFVEATSRKVKMS